MGPERIRLTGITKVFGTLKANDAVNLTLHAGEIHALWARMAPANPR